MVSSLFQLISLICKQTLFAGQELYKSTIRHYRFYFGFINGTNFRHGYDSLDPGNSLSRPSLAGLKMLTSPWFPTSSRLMVVPVSLCISWMILPCGPITAPINSLSINISPFVGACGFTSGLAMPVCIHTWHRGYAAGPCAPVPVLHAWYPC